MLFGFLKQSEPAAAKDSPLSGSSLYRFKRDVLAIVAQMNHGVRHDDCESLRRQTMFVQSQLFHSLYNDPAVPRETKQVLIEYHLKSVKSTVGERREGRAREMV